MSIVLIANNGKPVTAEHGGGVNAQDGHALVCNRDVAGPWEQFDEIVVSPGVVALRCASGQFVTCEPDGSISTNRTANGAWESWTKVGNSYQGVNGKFLSAQLNTPDGYLVCNRDSAAGWETFTQDGTSADTAPSSPQTPRFIRYGQRWTLRGYTHFAGLKHYIDEVDDRGVRSLMTKLGLITPRILCMAGNLFDLKPAVALAHLDAYAELLHVEGLYPMYVLLADCARIVSHGSQVTGILPNLDDQRAFVASACAILSKYDCLVSLVNEYNIGWQAVDPLQFDKPTGVNISRGSGGENTVPILPAWDWCEVHYDRSDRRLRNIGKGFPDIHDGFTGYAGTGDHVLVDTEPIGAADQPAGNRSNDPRDFNQLGIALALYGGGGIFHSQAGLQNDPWSPTQLACAAAFAAGLNAVPEAD